MTFSGLYLVLKRVEVVTQVCGWREGYFRYFEECSLSLVRRVWILEEQ